MKLRGKVPDTDERKKGGRMSAKCGQLLTEGGCLEEGKKRGIQTALFHRLRMKRVCRKKK